MDLGIKGKLALVTASGSGMGRNAAHMLAAEGASVVLFSRSADRLSTVCREIETQHGVTATPVAGDMTNHDDVLRLAATLESLGGPDILVLVSARPPNPLRETLKEDDQVRWDDAYRAQLWSVIDLVTVTVPRMIGRGWGRIVAVTSASAKQPMAVHALSTVFRAGVTAYMKGLATELAPHGITVNCVAPALIDTSHREAKAAYTQGQAEHRRTLTPMGRLGTQEELCGVITFLASRQAGFVTGSTIAVEGGMVSSLF
jgi:3-oxoacyl-[acyl-carrier protein] reductase